MKTELLIPTNGFKGTWAAIEYGVWLAELMQAKVTLLGVTESLSPGAIDDHHPLEDIFANAVELFQKKGLEYSLEIRNGQAEQVIPERANQKPFLTVVSPLGRSRLRHWLTGRSFRGLMEEMAPHGVDRLELELIAHAVNSAYEGVAHWMWEHPDVSLEQLADWTVELLLPRLRRFA